MEPARGNAPPLSDAPSPVLSTQLAAPLDRRRLGVGNIYDRLAKEALGQALAAASREIIAERELAPDAQRLDLWCVPDPDRVPSLAPLGWIERIARVGPCAFEFFHHAPSLAELLGSLRKLLYLRRSARFPARPDEPTLWIVAAGRPERVLKPLGFSPARSWPTGFYSAPPALMTYLIVTSELPRTRETLLLRVLGAGRTFAGVTRELAHEDLTDPVRAILSPLLTRLHLEWRDPEPLDPETQEFLMATRDIYETWYRNVRAEGEALGRAEGEAHALLAVLAARGLELSPEQATLVRECRDVSRLDAWLLRAATATSAAEVFD